MLELCIMKRLGDQADQLHKHFANGDSENMKLLMAENELMAKCADDDDYQWLTIPLNFGKNRTKQDPPELW